jgi:undecaprenyl-diphosphatase
LRTVALAVSAAASPVAVDALTVITVIVVWVWGAHARRVQAVVYLVAARLVELGIETGVKYLTNRHRPMLPHPLATAQDPSFPSGHTAGTAVLCACLLVLAWPGLSRVDRCGWVGAAAAAIIAVGASRVLLGLHSVTDVLGGALLGTATGAGPDPDADNIAARHARRGSRAAQLSVTGAADLRSRCGGIRVGGDPAAGRVRR